MARFVVNEWLWEDLGGENGPEAQQRALRFLEKVFEVCDQIVVVEGSPFVKKFYSLAKTAATGEERRAVKFFMLGFLHNTRKCVKVSSQDLEELSTALQTRVKDDDRYLIQAYLKSEADLLITSDKKLIEALCAADPEIRCEERDKLVYEYLKRDPRGET